MITFKQFLNEIFDRTSILPWRTDNISDPFLASFRYNTSMFRIAINQRKSSSNNVTYTVSFDRNGSLAIASQFDIASTIKIYNTVADIIKTRLIAVMKSGDDIEFSSWDERTNKVYSKFAKIIAKEIGGKLDREYGTYRITKL